MPIVPERLSGTRARLLVTCSRQESSAGSTNALLRYGYAANWTPGEREPFSDRCSVRPDFPVLPSGPDRRQAVRMAEALTTEPIPLVFGDDGVMRVRGTRVTLETVLSAFAEGATAEEIAQRYPSISLADAYQVIGYCLRHASELEPYLERRRQDIRETRRSNESIWPPVGIRDRLAARREFQ